MQACYRRVRNEGGGSIPETEQRTIRNAIIDYGALQPSPVQAEDEVNTPAASNVTILPICPISWQVAKTPSASTSPDRPQQRDDYGKHQRRGNSSNNSRSSPEPASIGGNYLPYHLLAAASTP